MSIAQTGKKYVIPPHVQADRMNRYSIYLLVGAFVIIGFNYRSLTMTNVLWFAAGLCACFALLCAIAVVILHAIAWNFDRLREEAAGGRPSTSVGSPDAGTGRPTPPSSPPQESPPQASPPQESPPQE
jgi:hypothetical protein